MSESEIVVSSTFRAHWAHYLDRLIWRGESFVIERWGKKIAVLVPYDDYMKLRQELPAKSSTGK